MSNIYDLIKSTTRQGPSFFQLHFFVIGKEPTLQSKMHKCLEEIGQRHAAIQNVELEIEELNDVIELHQLDIKRADRRFQAEEREIRIRQINRKIKSTVTHIQTLKDKIDAWQDEIKFLSGLFEQIADKVDLKNWNDYDVQLEYWNEKMAQEIRQRLIMNVPVDIELIKTTLSLPDSAPIKQHLLEHAQEQKPALRDK